MGRLATDEQEQLMRKLMVSKTWIFALLLAVLAAGCGDPDKNANTANAGAPTTPPTVTNETPPNASTLICPNTAVITATFSKAMNPATLNTTTFTLAGPGGTSVSGAVTYVAATDGATFSPAGPLSASTAYTATITTGAQDTFGNALAANFVWTFTTSPVCPNPGGAGGAAAAVPLGAACTFGILAATPSVTSAGPSNVTGDIGVWPAASIVGFPPGTLTGAKHPGDSVAQTAQGDLTIAYNNAAAAAGGAILPADIGVLSELSKRNHESAKARYKTRKFLIARSNRRRTSASGTS
jgi:hypothetical protein